MALFAAAFLILILARPRSVIWRGKPAAFWIARLNFINLDDSFVLVPARMRWTGHMDYFGEKPASAEDFLFDAGPKVIPELIAGLGYEDRWWAGRWESLYTKLGPAQGFFPTPLNRANYRANCARALGLIGPAASNALPALLKRLNDSDAAVKCQAAESLGSVHAKSEKVIIALLDGLSSTNSNFKLACLNGLTHCAPASPAWANAIRGALKDPDPTIRASAAGSLWRDRSDCDGSLRSLIGVLKDTNAIVRERAAESLGRMHCNESFAAEALKLALDRETHNDQVEAVELRIIASLGQLGAPARPAIPLLTSIVNSTNLAGVFAVMTLSRIEPQEAHWIDELIGRLGQVENGDAFWAARELGKHGELARQATGPLRELAESTRGLRSIEMFHVRAAAMAATSLWRLDPSSPNPISSITLALPIPLRGSTLGPYDEQEYEIVRLINELGPTARGAASNLRGLRNRCDKAMRDLVDEALQAVAPECLYDPWHAQVDG